MKTELAIIGILTLLGLSSPASAQPLIYEQGARGSVPAGDGCEEGEIPDDGTVEAGIGWDDFIAYAGFVERFDASAFSSELERICICLVQAPSFPPDFEQSFNLVVYDDDGPEGAPGNLLATIPAIATNVPAVLPGAFYS